MKLNLLIVDDEQMIVRGMKHILENACGEHISSIRSATSPHDAIRMARESSPDVVITDIKMPQMTGLELIQRMRLEAAPLSQYIVVSGYSEYQLVREALQLHAVDYLVKPAKTNDLRNAIVQAGERLADERSQLQQSNARQDDLRQSFLVEAITQLTARRGPAKETLMRMSRVLRDHAPLGELVCGFVDGGPLGERGCETRIQLLRRFERPGMTVAHASRSEQALAFVLATDASTCTGELDEIIAETGCELIRSAASATDRIVVSWSTRASDIALIDRLYVEANDARVLKVHDASAVHAWCAAERALPDRLTTELRVDLSQAVHAHQASMVNGLVDQAIRDFVCTRRTSGALLQIVEVFEQVIEEHGDTGCDLRSAFSLADLVQRTKTSLNEADQTEPASGSSLRERVDAYVWRHLGGDLTMQAVADSVELSYSYFSATFRREVGLPFSEHLLKLRMEEARRLLGTGTLPVCEVSSRVGYRSPKHFSRVFRSYFDLAPSAMKARNER